MERGKPTQPQDARIPTRSPAVNVKQKFINLAYVSTRAAYFIHRSRIAGYLPCKESLTRDFLLLSVPSFYYTPSPMQPLGIHNMGLFRF